MAVKTESFYHATEALILSSPRKFYRAYMHADHWQLRSFISSPKPNIIYYPGGTDIYRLNTVTREREIITTLPFSPRCLVAAEDWICCGGEHGNFASIRIGPSEGHVEFAPISEADGPDSRLPFELDPVRRLYLSSQTDSLPRQARSSVSPLARATKVGKEIVNCVTLWFPQSNSEEQVYSKPVAVLSNNDHSISIVDLQENEELEKLELDDCVNRAVISPDGTVLIAIGDDPYMHIYQRRASTVEIKSPLGSKSRKEYRWRKCNQVQLPGQRRSDKEEMRGSFAAAFSTLGRYLAVGTQYGLISVFNTSLLTLQDEDPLLVTFTSTRPHEKTGAIRAMQFCPGPFDLLAWTEDSGRVVIADVRHHFMSRQVIIVDNQAEGLDIIGIIERANESAIDPRLRSFRGDIDGAVGESIGADLDRRQLQRLTREAREVLDRHQSPFTADDTEVLEVLQMQRRRREREAAREALASVTQLSWTDLDDLRSNLRSATERRSPLPSSLREFVSGRGNDTLRAYINERNQERERRGQQPRRRGSVILAAAQSALERESREASRAPVAESSSESRDRDSRLELSFTSIGNNQTNPWSEMEALYNMSVNPSVDPASRLRIEVEPESRTELRQTDDDGDFARRSNRDAWRSFATRHEVRLPSNEVYLSRSRRPELNETTGCAWSPDGRTLYVGTENGIFEYQVNLDGRKLFPSITVR